MITDFKVETINEVYLDIINTVGEVHLIKPKPGDTYRKRYKPLSHIDRDYFKNLPADIEAISPPRLYESKSGRYRGRIWKEYHTHWHFHYQWRYADNLIGNVMSIRVLSYCYQPSSIIMIKPISPIQLKLL